MGSATRFLLLLTPSPLIHHRCPSLIRLTRHHNRLSPSLCSFFHHLNHPLFIPPSPPLCPTTSAAASGNKNTRLLPVKCSSRQLHVQTSSLSHSPTPPRISHPWPEFHALLDCISATGYFSRQNGNDEFVASPDLMEDFTRSASACLSFARDRPNLLGMLSRNDIKVVVENGTPFLFEDGEESVRRMKLFLENNVLDTDKATTDDLMKYLLSYASNIFTSLEANKLYNRQLVESSVRNLLGELAKLSGLMENQFPGRYGQTRAPFGQNIEMKRGDWICPRCSFMNFAKNMKCLECEEARPKRQLTGGEWECPQCCYHNYRKNIVCLRCDCKRPGEVSLSNSPNSGSVLDQGHWDYSNKSDIDRKLAENEEKAQRWFSKVSQMDSTSDMNSVIEDEDFPEIMPLRKGVNRFVVSTRKTPLERRLANAQYRRNLGNDGTPEATNDNTLGKKVSHTLDNILGCTSASSDQNPGAKNFPRVSSPGSSHGSSGSVPFVPLTVDMFAQKHENEKIDGKSHFGYGDYGNCNSDESLNLSEKPVNQKETEDRENDKAEKSGRRFMKGADLNDFAGLASEVPGEDFPEMMPMRKGENRFVVGKKKDRSLTSPMYKRRAAMEQPQISNFVPFVPFPPDYFAKKDKQPENADLAANTTSVTSTNGNMSQDNHNPLANNNDGRHKIISGTEVTNSTGATSQPNEKKNRGHLMKDTPNSGLISSEPAESKSGGYPGQGLPDVTSDSNQMIGNESTSSWTGKSLEGSAVKEPNPLDMSEEAKAERWFRRVAQIKDISELSQIPDEDFPSIMPMRKGVNRFVVSKRKTPLERRLTSQQYRRNLPIVSSDPVKSENDKEK